MVEKYELIQKAEAIIPYEQHDERYATFYFMALRHVGMGLKESVQAVRAKLRKQPSEIKYTMLFFGGLEEVKEMNIDDQDGAKFIMSISKLRGAKKHLAGYAVAEPEETPKGVLGQLIWLEAIRRTPSSNTMFTKTLRKVRSEIVNPNGG